MDLKYLKHISAFASLALFAACAQQELPLQPDSGVTDDGDYITVSASVNVSGIQMAETRAIGATPDYAGLKLYAIEFECKNAQNPAENVIANTYDSGDEITNEQFDGTDMVTFNIRLNKTESARVLHLIAVPKDIDFRIGYGTEAYVIPNLYTTDGNEAYWNRIVFENGYGVQDGDTWTTHDAVKTSLTRVPMIRNFSQVSIINNATDNFTLTGFAVVNVPDRGSVAPWNYSEGKFAELLNGSDMKPYATISSDGYYGFSPAGSMLTDFDADGTVFDDTPKFMYERPFPENNLDRSFVIVCGRYSKDNADSYYKVDLGKNNDAGIFNYYHILRNINYHITINQVEASGYSTAAEALTGVVCNNFSFDVDTGNLTNVSDGNDILFVNFTAAVITQADQTDIEFKYRYRKVNNSTTFNNDNINLVDLEPGDVIESVTTSTADDKDGWRSVKIKTYNPTQDTKTQKFTIVDPATGLGRTITLILRTPWTLQNPEEFAGRFSYTYPNAEEAAKRRGKAGGTAGRYLTIFFNLPDELNEAMFPLTFTVESDRQDIENDPIGNLLVKSGNSMFVNGATRIQYEKTVTWRQYNEEKTKENPNNTVVVDENGRTIHRVRCRFLTITDVPSGVTLTTNVRIQNPYFNDITVEFERVGGDNYPDITEP